MRLAVFLAIGVGIAFLWASNPLAGVVASTIAGIAFLLNWQKGSTPALQQPSDADTDEQVERAVDRALEGTKIEINRIKNQMSRMPGIGNWDIVAAPDTWES